MKILFIPHTLPWPVEKHGAAQRSGLLLKALKNWGEVDVIVATETRYFEQPAVREAMVSSKDGHFRRIDLDFTRELSPWHHLSSLTRGKLRGLLSELGRYKADFLPEEAAVDSLRRTVQHGGYDVIVSRHLRWATKSGAAFLHESNVLLDYDDLDWRLHRSREEQQGTRSVSKRLRDFCTRYYLERMARRSLKSFAHIWAASEEDRKEIGLPNCSVLPNVPILPPGEGRGRKGDGLRDETILFVGLLGYGPNAQGLDRFLRKTWPVLLHARPSVRLKVVGTPPENSKWIDAWKQSPNVDWLGFVDDLDEVYARALFTIAPIYWGGGTKIKVLESLGRGRTCVATPHALYGIGQHIRHNDSVLCADTDEDFVRGCITLLKNPGLRQRMESKGAEVVQSHYSIETFNQAIDEVMCQFQESAATRKA